MVAQVAQKYNTKIIHGTTSEILNSLVSLGYPTPIAVLSYTDGFLDLQMLCVLTVK